MLDKLTGKPVHYTIHLLACFTIAVGLPWSKIPLSLGTMLLFANLLLKADFKNYWSAWKQNPWLKALAVYVLFEWISILWSSNLNYALTDFRIKLPLYAIPLVLVAFPIKSLKTIYLIVLAFLSVLLITSLINFGSYYHWWGNKTYDDIRGMSLFGSHIRYSLEIVMGVVICLGWILRKLPYYGIAFVISAWLIIYTYYSQILSGYIALSALILAALLLLIKNIPSKPIKLTILLSFLGLTIGSGVWLYSELKPIPHKLSISDLSTVSKHGESYYFDKNTRWENGYPVLAQVAEKELEQSWNSVSSIPYHGGKDIKGNPIHFTLMTYMTSKGLTKDKEGFKQLCQKEIRLIEAGTNSILVTKGGLNARLHGIRMQIEYSDNPNGHSLLQRLEYWKAAKNIIANNWFLGVGSGDIDDTFKQFYRSSHSKLSLENRHRTHNQFLTSWITSGIFGFAAFVLWWLVQLKTAWKLKAFEWLCFAFICCFSFLTEDTIETQMGVTFVAFFFALFAANNSLLYRK